jgi:hypothetical protein
MTPLSAWESFYVVVGSSAGALTGLTFVVITLSAQNRQRGAEQRRVEGGIAAFTTPTTVAFGAVLFICAALSAPWPALAPPAVLLGLCGLAGLVYSAIVLGRQRRLEGYTPVLEDWLSYVISPFVVSAALLVAGILLPGSPEAALFIVGGATLLLLFLGIHNAWDLVTFITITRHTPQDEPNERVESR